MKDQAMMTQFTHITLNSGHSYMVPVGKVVPSTIKSLRDLVKAGGGPIPVSKRLSFCLTSDDDCCAFSIYKNSVPVLMCVYHEGSGKAESVWNNLLSDNARFGVGQTMKMPTGPWLAVVLLPTAFLAARDLPMLADFEQCVAETWRRLPVSERSPIRSPALERIVQNLKKGNLSDEDPRRNSENNHDDSAEGGRKDEPMMTKAPACRECETKQTSLLRLKTVLKDAELRETELRTTASGLRAEAAVLAGDKRELEDRIASLSTEALQREVESLKAVIESKDYRILELEEEVKSADDKTKGIEGTIDNQGRRIKWLENRLRTNGIPLL